MSDQPAVRTRRRVRDRVRVRGRQPMGFARRAVVRRPGVLLGLLAAATVIFGGLATQLEVDTDIKRFAADSPLARGLDRIEEDFISPAATIQVVIDAGAGGNVLSPEGLAVPNRVEQLANDTPEIADILVPDRLADPAILSYAGPFHNRLAALDTAVNELPEAFVASFVTDTLEQVGERIGPLLSTDADFDEATARAGLAVIRLDPTLDEDALREASIAFREVLAAEDFGWFDVAPFSMGLLYEDIDRGVEQDLPSLLTVSIVLVIVILWLLFRRASDVALGIGAVGLAIIWMTGVAALLGPGLLGVTGEFSQIAIAVPVLLIGLGIDYTVHLVARYRENRSAGHQPTAAADRAMRTVGIALVLATVATAVGFLANLTSPLPPIADFGIFAAAGIVAALIVTWLLVPGTRAILDRRRAAREPEPAAAAKTARDGVTGLGRLLGGVAAAAARAPAAVLAVVAVTTGIAVVAASNLDTEFSTEDFITADSQAGQVYDLTSELFGGNVAERTYVLIEGDLTDPVVANALLEVRERIAEIPGVVTAGDLAEETSPASLIDTLERAGEGLQAILAAQLAVLADPVATVEGLPLPVLHGPDDLPADVIDAAGDEITTSFSRTAELEARLPAEVSVEQAVLRVVPPADLDLAVRNGLAEQLRSGRPDGVDVGVLAAAAALQPQEIDRAALAASGLPLDLFDEATLDLVDTVTELHDLGWDGQRLAADSDLGALYEAARRQAPTALDGVLADDARSGLMTITTTAGERGATELAEALEAELAPLRGLGVNALVASQTLLIDETVDGLIGAQTTAIFVSLGAAALLVTGYYGVATRRPALGLIAMIPSLLGILFTLGTMWLLGLAYNAFTATIASIAIGIGVPYGIHVTNRFVEQRRRAPDPGTTIRSTMRHTGAALTGSAVTSAAAFAVLGLSGLGSLRQFGIILAIMILFALIAALFAETSCLVLWDRYHRRREQPPTPPLAVGRLVSQLPGEKS